MPEESPDLHDLRPHLPPESRRRPLKFTATYSEDDFKHIVAGFAASDMDEKWNIIYRAPWLYFHRSWTGIGCYGVRFEPGQEGVSAVEAWVNVDVFESHPGYEEYDSELVRFLISVFLLRRSALLPVSGNRRLSGIAALAHMHVVAGVLPPLTLPEEPPK